MINRRRKLLCVVLLLIMLIGTMEDTCTVVRAEQIKNADVFANVQWSYEAEWGVGSSGSVQSMCETNQYIVCFQDTGKKGENDVLSVFDRWSYELLFTVSDMDYEHGNGMTFNPNSNEIYITPYNPKQKKNKGMIFALDADTLQFKRRIQISDGTWNAASIEYVEGSNQYIVQTTKQRNYAFIVLDSDFNEIDYLFDGERSTGNIFQDFCVSGDFIISVPYMNGTVKTPGVHLYSISQKQFLGFYPISAPGTGAVFEPQSICQSDGGRIMMVIFLSGRAKMAIYEAYVPVIYTVTTGVENGEITPTRGDVDIGTNYKVSYSCDEDYELTQLLVDDQETSVEENPRSYTFGNIMSDHNIFARFTEIPKFEIATSVTNGIIEETQLVRRDLDGQITYVPDEHYELEQVIVDGEAVDASKYGKSYTFKDVQEPHTISVSFREIPSFAIRTSVVNGEITASGDKVYRDENYTVDYTPDKDYELEHIDIDGERQGEITVEMLGSRYTFYDVQQDHDIAVSFRWKYLPYAIIGGAFAACLPFLLLYVIIIRIQKRRRRNKLRRR